MKNSIFVFICIIQTIMLNGQESKEYNLLETDSTWTQEVFHFPLSFAPAIQYEGFEDARFPQNWSKKDSQEFWSYVFAWRVSNPIETTPTLLENNLEKYFNGLMKYDETTAVFLKHDNVGRFVGKIKTYDALITQKKLTLNVIVEYDYCEESKKSFLVFRFSPQEFNSKIWDKLLNVQLRAGYCEI